ncbi:hypothetical protein CEE37_03370 [candidate division LCP-89 bacterium B3_LCP]|uniref:Uncharacterized protein n=1 Tax=candidate division LCP-89 bacterium B3_LCP TaxID=2012998 RepID=A0A532V388_UNCL8|nr:MAG: hypothetical protein CEE37_03370 [candidate division LCP-89 bacterium B3_LCP]
MSKINPLQRVPGLPDQGSNDKNRIHRSDKSYKMFELDKVEISREAREVQRTENAGAINTGHTELTNEARKMGNQWYLVGYHMQSVNK